MSDIRMSMTLTPATTGQRIGKAGKLAPAVITQLVTEIIEETRTEIVKRTPVGFSGAARRGWTTEVRGRHTPRVRGLVLNPVLHIPPLEEGRRPGRRPPIEAIIPWVGSKLGVPPGPARRSVAFLVARKIGARGTQGAHMIEDGWEATRRRIKPRLKEAGVRIVRTI